jgi:RND superfamily putative drug exporter
VTWLARIVTGRRSRWIVVAVWVVAAIGAGAFQPKLQEATENDTLTYLPGDSESAEALRVQRESFTSGSITPTLLLVSTSNGEPMTQKQRDSVDAFLREVDAAKVKTALQIMPPFTPEGQVAGQLAIDGTTAYGVLPLTGTDADRDIIPAIEETRKLVEEELPDGFDGWVTGPGGVVADQVEVFSSVDGPLLAATLLLVLILLVVIYRSPVIWTIPVLTVVLAYMLASGLVYGLVAADWFDVNGQTTAILIVLMFGAGTDYCLLLIARLREFLKHTEDASEAVASALTATFPAILSSGATVVAAMLVLAFAELDSTASMGPVLALGVACTMLAALTLLPALLAIVGRRAFWPRVPLVEDDTIDPATLDQSVVDLTLEPEPVGVWERIAAAIELRPMRALVVGVGVLLVLTLGNAVDSSSMGFGDPDAFTTTTDSQDGFEVLRDHFPAGALAPVDVLVQSDDATTVQEASRKVADALRQEMVGEKPRVAMVVAPPVPTLSEDGTWQSMRLVLSGDPFSPGAEKDIAHLRKIAQKAASGDDRVLIGGPTAQVLDTHKAIDRDERVLIPAVLALIFLILVGLLRALVAPLHLIASVVLSFFATLGVTTWLFTSVLDHPGVDAAFATYLFIFVVSLGVDYNIFLVHRVRAEALTHGTHVGVVRALASTGSVITSAGIVLAGTFLVLATLPVVTVKQIGIGVAVGVLLDTLVVRSVIVPATMLLLGDRNWWPGRVDPSHDEVL